MSKYLSVSHADHPVTAVVNAYNRPKMCRMCSSRAAHKIQAVGECLPCDPDPVFLCCDHFQQVVGYDCAAMYKTFMTEEKEIAQG